MTMVNNWTSGHGLMLGKYHEVLTGRVSKTYATPDGDAAPWKDAPPGSIHMYEDTGGSRVYIKVKDDDEDGDWFVSDGFIAQKVALADFTDGGAAVGTLTLDGTIPLGAIVDQAYVHDVTGFAGDTSCTLTIGDGTDVDRYNTGTPSIFTTITHLSVGVPSGTAYHAAAKQPVLTATSGSDWGAVTAGAFVVVIHYRIPH